MRINVITINLNNKDGLQRTIQSVIGQTMFDKVDYIIINGGSTDGSVDVINRYRPFLCHSVSEKDGGIYNAMNKGAALATDEYTIFLNSGDHFYDETAIESIYGHLDADIVYGDLNIHHIKKEKGCFVKRYPDYIPNDYFTYEALPHEAAFIRTTLLKRKPYREDYRIISDTIFFHESIVEERVSYRHVDVVLTDFYLGGISSLTKRMLAEKDRYFKTRQER